MGRQLEYFGGDLMRFHLPGDADDLVQDGRAIAVNVEFQQRTLREKNLGGTPSSSPSVRGAGRFPLPRGWSVRSGGRRRGVRTGGKAVHRPSVGPAGW